MKTYPTTVNELRRRICANPECGKLICPKNPKAIYCGLECKNKATQVRLHEQYGEEYKWFKMYLHNIKVLAAFYNDGRPIVNDVMLDALKFNRPVGKLPEIVNGKGSVLIYGQYMLYKFDDKSYKIIKI